MMRIVISRSLGRKLAVTCLAVLGFVLLHEVSMFDSQRATPGAPVDPTRPTAGSHLLFTATAYCKGTTTTSGVGVRTGIAASDPAILPVGSVVNVSTDETRYNGVYTIMDTGPSVQGRILDLFMGSCGDARMFGRRPVEITVLRLGWSPAASTPSLIDRLFRRREAARDAAPAVFTPPADIPAQNTAPGEEQDDVPSGPPPLPSRDDAPGAAGSPTPAVTNAS
jgi:3D (Asp-Asp-Asp) domain-containing protein